MRITRKSIITGRENTLELPVTQEQLDAYYKRRLPLVDAFPSLTPIQHEFIKHGVIPQERDQIFRDERS